MSDKPRIIFLLGLARSGTKLFRDLLNNHDQIAILPLESNFIPKLHRRFNNRNLRDQSVFHQFYEAFLQSVYVANLLGLGEEPPTEEVWFSACKRFNLGEVYRVFFTLTLLKSKPDAQVIGDKTPYYIHHTALLLKLFPDACFVHLVRDPRDRALSEQKTWGKSLRNSVHSWSMGMRRLHDALAAEPKRLIEVRYEDLLADPEQQLARVVDFLNLPRQKGLNSLAASPEKYGDARGATQVVATNISKFNGRIDPSTLVRLEELSLPWLRRYQYPVEHATRERLLPEAERKLLVLYDKLSLARFHIRDKGLIQGLIYFRKIAL